MQVEIVVVVEQNDSAKKLTGIGIDLMSRATNRIIDRIKKSAPVCKVHKVGPQFIRNSKVNNRETNIVYEVCCASLEEMLGKASRSPQ